MFCIFNVFLYGNGLPPEKRNACVVQLYSIIECVLGAGKLNTNCRGQHLSTDDLLEMAEEVNEKQVEYVQIQHVMCT